MVEYSDDFTLYITTKHHNPHFSADIATKVTLVNFTLTMEGLEDQLLGIISTYLIQFLRNCCCKRKT